MDRNRKGIVTAIKRLWLTPTDPFNTMRASTIWLISGRPKIDGSTVQKPFPHVGVVFRDDDRSPFEAADLDTLCIKQLRRAVSVAEVA
ncbi:hypothetical protein [Pseudaminobacter sp. NGMCC 1.201702]|uniref:hypothetical protein n=1 Tax=Pseudaminobacter sp. NGMCC 1.201702 TaxID=3391825 RepID=UPI0039EFE5E8